MESSNNNNMDLVEVETNMDLVEVKTNMDLVEVETNIQNQKGLYKELTGIEERISEATRKFEYPELVRESYLNNMFDRFNRKLDNIIKEVKKNKKNVNEALEDAYNRTQELYGDNISIIIDNLKDRYNDILESIEGRYQDRERYIKHAYKEQSIFYKYEIDELKRQIEIEKENKHEKDNIIAELNNQIRKEKEKYTELEKKNGELEKKLLNINTVYGKNIINYVKTSNNQAFKLGDLTNARSGCYNSDNGRLCIPSSNPYAIFICEDSNNIYICSCKLSGSRGNRYELKFPYPLVKFKYGNHPFNALLNNNLNIVSNMTEQPVCGRWIDVSSSVFTKFPKSTNVFYYN